jgi:hypothetical protein
MEKSLKDLLSKKYGTNNKMFDDSKEREQLIGEIKSTFK